METSSNILERCLRTRLTRLQTSLAERQVDGLLVSDCALRYWLGHPHMPLVFVTPEKIVTSELSQMASQIESTGAMMLGFDSSLSAVQLLYLQEALPHTRWTSFADELARLCLVKDAVEIALLRQAAIITRQIFERLEICEGRSELDLLYQAHRAMLDLGGSGFSFDPSIAGGMRSALPWAGVSSHQLRHGEVVLVDLGISFRGYQSDMARSYMVGESSSDTNGEWKSAMGAVEEALARVRSQALPGVLCNTLHLLCEHVLEEAGFGPMKHALGHGIGMQVHERPYLSLGSTDVLQAGMVIALEPSVVLSTGEGVRYEEVIVVTEHGGEFLA